MTPQSLSDPAYFVLVIIFHLSSVLMVTTFIANTHVPEWWLGTY